jgi:hypothetical protein
MCSKKLKPRTGLLLKRIKNLPDGNKNLPELVTSFLMFVQMWDISEVGWLVGMVKHATLVDSLRIVYMLLLSVSYIPVYPKTHFIDMLGYFSPLWGFRVFMEPHLSACFSSVTCATFTGNAIGALFHLLRISLQPGLREGFLRPSGAGNQKSPYSDDRCPWVNQPSPWPKE